MDKCISVWFLNLSYDIKTSHKLSTVNESASCVDANSGPLAPPLFMSCPYGAPRFTVIDYMAKKLWTPDHHTRMCFLNITAEWSFFHISMKLNTSLAFTPCPLKKKKKKIISSSPQFHTCSKRSWHSSNEDGFPGVQRLRAIHHKITVVQIPWTDLYLIIHRTILGLNSKFHYYFIINRDALINCPR